MAEAGKVASEEFVLLGGDIRAGELFSSPSQLRPLHSFVGALTVVFNRRVYLSYNLTF